jgi:cytochrome P450
MSTFFETSETSETSDFRSETDLPVIPVPRDARCPLRPPAEFADWREKPGLRRAMYHGQPTWMVSRYQDIRAALLDPPELGHPCGILGS